MIKIPPTSGERIRVDGPADTPEVRLATADGRWVTLHSARNPRAEATAWLDRALADLEATGSGAPGVIVVIGAGAGYILDEIQQRPGVSDRPVVVFEPDARLAEVCRQRRDVGAAIASGALRWLTAPDYVGASDLWRVFDRHPGAVLTLEHPVLVRECPDDVARAHAIVTRATFDAKANAEARRLFAGPYLLHTIQNLPTILGSGDVDALADIGNGSAALLVAAGPSLDRTIDEVRRLRDRAIVIAVDTALRPLLAAGIDPDLVVAVDPAELNARHLRDLPAEMRSWFVAEGSLHPTAFPAFAGRTFTFKVSAHDPWPWLQSLGVDRGVLRAWGSVLTSAFDLGLRLGCDPLVFVGADMAYTHGQPYCRGTTYEEDWAAAVAAGTPLPDVWAASLRARELVEAVDYNGQPTQTAPHLIAFRDWLAEQAALCGRRVVNATGGGILNGRGVEWMPLDRALATGRPVDPASLEHRIADAHRAAAGRRAEQAAALQQGASRPAARAEALSRWRTLLTAEQIASLEATLASHLHALDAVVTSSPAPAPASRGPARRARSSTSPRLWPPERTQLFDAIRRDLPCPATFQRPPDAQAADRALAAAANLLAADDAAARPDPDALELIAEAICLGPVQAAPPPIALPAGDARVLDLNEPLGIDAAPSHDARSSAGRDRLDALRVWAGVVVRRHAPTTGAPVPPFARLADAILRSATATAESAVTNPLTGRIVRSTVRLGEARRPVVDGLLVDPCLLADGLTGAVVDRTDATAAEARLAVASRVQDAPIQGDVEIATVAGPPPGVFDWTWPFSSRTGWLAYRNLTAEGFGRCYYAAQLPDGRALVVKVGVGRSAAIDAHGGETLRDAWPAPIASELPWGVDGGAVAWNADQAFVRRAAGGPAESFRMPAIANVAHIEADGRVLWPTLNAGLWQWDPSGELRCVAGVPPVNSIRPIDDGFELDPLVVIPGSPSRRVRLDYVWHWTPRRGVKRVPGRVEGQSWSHAACGDVVATAYSFSDLVRLRVGGHRTFDLYVPQPLMVAWAGRSLLVTTSSATVLLFDDLIAQLARG
jgi:hypothetical protein